MVRVAGTMTILADWRGREFPAPTEIIPSLVLDHERKRIEAEVEADEAGPVRDLYAERRQSRLRAELKTLEGRDVEISYLGTRRIIPTVAGPTVASNSLIGPLDEGEAVTMQTAVGKLSHVAASTLIIETSAGAQMLEAERVLKVRRAR